MADATNNGRRFPYTNLILGAVLSLLLGTLVASLTWWKDFAVRAQIQDAQIIQAREQSERLNRLAEMFNTMSQVDLEQSHTIKDLQRQLSEDQRYLEEILRRLRVLELGQLQLSEPKK